MVKQQKNNTRKKRSSKGFKANRTKAREIDASTEYETYIEFSSVRLTNDFQSTSQEKMGSGLPLTLNDIIFIECCFFHSSYHIF